MKKTYSPRSDSLAAKVIAQLPQVGGQLSAVQIAETFVVAEKAVAAALRPAIAAGALAFTVDAESGKRVYSLATEEPTPRKKRAAPARKTAARKRRQPAAVEETPQEPGELAIAMHSDRDVTFLGAVVGEDGSVLLKQDQAEQLARYIVRQASVNMFL